MEDGKVSLAWRTQNILFPPLQPILPSKHRKCLGVAERIVVVKIRQ